MRKTFVFGLAFLLLLVGCNTPKLEDDQTNLILNKDQSVLYTIVEAFDEDYYKLDELEQMANDEIQEYNKTADGAEASLMSLIQEEEKVVMKLQFTDASAFTGMIQLPLFVGTIDQALEEGYSLNVTLHNPAGDKTVSEEEIKAMGKRHIAILQDNVLVQCFGKILYISEGASIQEKMPTVAKVTDEKVNYIIFK